MFHRLLDRAAQTLFIGVLAAAAVCARTPTEADKQLEVFGHKIPNREAGPSQATSLLQGLGGWMAAAFTLAPPNQVAKLALVRQMSSELAC